MFTKMGRQIGGWIILFILLIESVILITSYSSKKMELTNLKIALEKDVLSKTGGDFHAMHPGILDDSHIDKLMAKFIKNVLILSIIIAILTAIGAMYVFHLVVGKHIVRLTRLNSMNRGTKVAKWKKMSNIPENEVGELILEREELLVRLEKNINNSNK